MEPIGLAEGLKEDNWGKWKIQRPFLRFGIDDGIHQKLEEDKRNQELCV